MIYEGSCDFEDWRNYAENKKCITTYIVKYI